MSRIILVRHALPVIDPERPSEGWILAAEARAATITLADALAAFAPQVVLCGAEPKIEGTGAILAEQFGIENVKLAGLSEHARRTSRFMDQATFEAAIKALFEQPGDVVFGEESADTTHTRFASTLDAELAQHGGTVIAVSGGTAISIFLSRRAGVDAFTIWKSLRMPMAFVLDRARWKIERTI